MEQPPKHLSAMSQQKDAPAAIMAGFYYLPKWRPKNENSQLREFSKMRRGLKCGAA
jgi:hypothetical protein